jgi:hypothetical protein
MDPNTTPTHDGFLVAVDSKPARYFAKNKGIIFGNAATIGGTFEYKVQARYAKLSKVSDTVSTTLTITLPAAPTFSSVTANGGKTLTFNVNSIAGVDSFMVYRNGVPIRSLAPSSSLVVDKLPGGLSTYQLRAFTSSGVSPLSAAVAIKVL